MEQDQLHLPVLLRSDPLRSRFPFCSHLVVSADAYKNRVAWAKMAGFSPWPSRIATADEIKALWVGKPPVLAANQSLEEHDSTEDSANDWLCMYFLGSHQLGIVKRNSLELDYVGRFAENSQKCTTRNFLLGLEEADGWVLREVFKEGCGSCMVCGGKDAPTRIILCDRCNSELHLDCLKPSIATVPEGMWMCPICVVEAPLTYQMESKRTRSEIANGGAPTPITAASDGSSTTPRLRKRNDDTQSLPATATQLSSKRHRPSIVLAVAGSKWSPEEDAVLWTGIMHQLTFQEICSQMDRSYSGCVHRHKELLRKGYQPPPNLDALVQQHQKQLEAKRKSTAPAAAAGAVPAVERPQVHVTTRSAAPVATTTTTTTTPPAAESTTSQLSQLLRIAQMPAMHREPAHTCFVCKLSQIGGGGGGGDLIACGDPICGKHFHAYCLGSRAPQDFEERWFCPWHHCSLCTSHASPPSLFAKRTKHHSELNPVDFQGTCTLAAADEPVAAEEEEETPLPSITFARCISCPLALCGEHINAPFEGQPMQRNPDATTHFFLCERCEQQPISLAKSLDLVLTTAVLRRDSTYYNNSTLMFRPGAQMLLSCASPELARALLGTERSKPLSCGELQAMVRQNKFQTVVEFEKQLADMCNTLHAVFKWKHPKLAQSAREFQGVVMGLVRTNSVELAALERNSVKLNGRAAPATTTTAQCLCGTAPWETYARVPAAEAEEDKEEESVDPRTTFSYLFQALEAARLVQPIADTAEQSSAAMLLTPSEHEIESMFEAHSSALRSSLVSAARLRSEVSRVYATLRSAQDTVMDLQKQLDEAKQALLEEQAARSSVELQLASALASSTPSTAE